MAARTFVIDAGGTARLFKTPWVIDPGGTARKLKKIWVIDVGGTARLVFSGAVVPVATPNTAQASGLGPATLQTNFVLVTATGGSPPYTFAWSRVSGSAVPVPTSFTSASVAWGCHITAGSNFVATWQCAVTDTGNTTGLVQVTVNIQATN
jgi:hypothetical protein